MTVSPGEPGLRPSSKRWLWFVGLYAASITGLAVVTGLMRWLIKGL